MTAPAAQQRYTMVAIALHWIIAFSIIGMLAAGWIMDSMAGGPGSPKIAIIQLHKSFGITILLLSVARIIWRLMNPPPPEPPMPAVQKYVATGVHILLYVAMIAMPLTGWIMASAEINQHETRFFGTFEMYVPGIVGLPDATREAVGDGFEFVHHNLAWVIVGLLVLHLAGALKHQLVDKDGLMARMAPGLFGRTAGAPDNGHGALWAFGAAVLIFVVVAGVSMIPAAPETSGPQAVAAAVSETQQPVAPAPVDQSKPDQIQQTPATPATPNTKPPSPQTPTQQAPQGPTPAPTGPAPTWIVDSAKSSVVFKGSYMGRDFQGKFGDWKATIQLDPSAAPNKDTPVPGYVKVAFPMAKAVTGEEYFDDNVSQGDWFNVKKYPEASFEVKGGLFKLTDTQYEATGVLTLKGADFPVRLPFTLKVDGKTATMHGEVSLKRLTLGIGRDTLAKANPRNPDEDWVKDDVVVVVDVTATRQ